MPCAEKRTRFARAIGSLQKEVTRTNEQLASLELYAKEVSIAYGIRQRLEGPPDITGEGKLVPSFSESVQDYDFLRSTNVLAMMSRSTQRLQPGVRLQPLDSPIAGRLMGSFGDRTIPSRVKARFTKAWISARPPAHRCM